MTLTASTPDHRAISCDPSSRPTGRRAARKVRRASGGRRWWLLACVAAVAVSALPIALGGGPLIRADGGRQLVEFLSAAVTPRLDGQFLLLVASATLTTLAYALLGTAVSLVIGLVGGVVTSQAWWRVNAPGARVRRMIGWGATRGIFVIPRGIHEVIWGLALLIVLGPSPVVAVLAIGIPFGAVTAKVFSELLDESSQRPYEAVLACGASRRSAVIYGLLPPALGDLVSYSFYRFECSIRSATILGLVGAGGLGAELMDSFRALVYPEMWTLLYALIALSALADAWSSLVRTRLVLRQRRRARAFRGDPLIGGSLGLIPVLVALAAWWIELDLAVLWNDSSARQFSMLIAETWPFAMVDGGFATLIELSGTTLAMSVLAMVVALSIGSLLAVPAAALPQLSRGSGRRPVRRWARFAVVAMARLLLIVLRAVPPPVWALLVLFIFYPGLLPGALALGIYTAGVMGRLMAEAADNLNAAPLRALRAQGASPAQVLCYGVIPAASPRFAAYALYRWEITVRETVVVGVVGAAGLGVLLQHQLNSFHFAQAATLVLTLVVLTLVVDLAGAAIRRSIR